jgi:acetoacetyl-CoA synthetase
MPLFICMEEGESLTDELRSKIVGRLRREGSPRHVPDEIVVVPAIPYTTTGKKLEVPIRKLLMGFPAAQVASWDALADRSVLDWFLAFVDRREKDTQQKLCAGDKL